MKKRYYTVANLLFSSLITMLGLGACKSNSKVEKLPTLVTEDGTKLQAKMKRSQKDIRVVYGPPPVSVQEKEAQRAAEEEYLREQERQRKEKEKMERERREREEKMKVVYGPPVSRDWRKPVPDSEGVYDIAETMPSFPGGATVLLSWINENLRYPQKAREEGIGGRVVVNFIVRPDGTVDGAIVVRKIHPLLDAEALRLVKSMPKWKPGMMDGKFVPVKYTIPIRFVP